jgi:methylenetetrahydrofolate dehydrogenase (NADP+) / methenyltetrahydrofolate cyclohydrolase
MQKEEMARKLDGTALAAVLRQEATPRVATFLGRYGRPPGLAVVLAGENPASEIYVRHKLKAVGEAGCRAELFRLSDSSTIDEALALVESLNQDDAIDAILVQSPLPSTMGRHAEQRVFDTIRPDKDVDGFHPENVGLLVQKRPRLVACTPAGCIELLEREGIPLRGRHAVVIGRSDIVGKPMALLLLHRDATVTVCHSQTPDLQSVARSADVLVAAIGRAGFVTQEFVKPGATVIDVGINRVDDAQEMERLFAPDSPRWRTFGEKGSTTVGDVHPNVDAVAGAYTPVPGGVGPITVAMVLRNTLTAAESRMSKR